MSLASATEAARRGHLYPAVILHGGGEQERRQAALELARTLLCEVSPERRPCGDCRHCRRIVWPGAGEEHFHPDFQVLERDLKTSTSVEAARELLKTAQVSPFEARGQVFAVANAETLSGEAANALLKVLEEPQPGAPRNFFLLAPSQFDLLPTLRSRSLAVFLGTAAAVDTERAAELGAAFAGAATAWAQSRSAAHLLAAAAALAEAGRTKDEELSWKNPRATRSWSLAAAAVLAAVGDVPPPLRRRLLALAEALLDALPLRLRGIPAERILEGLVSRHLAS